MMFYVIEMQTEVFIFGLALIYHLGWVHISAIVLYFIFYTIQIEVVGSYYHEKNNGLILPPGFYFMFDLFKLTSFFSA